MDTAQQYIDLFNEHRAMIERHAAPALNNVRKEAFDNFVRLGFPDKKQEDHRYTDIAPLFAPDYGLNINRLEIPVNPYDAFKCDVPNMSTALHFVVNDSYYTQSESPVALPEGVIIGSLDEAAHKHPQLVEKYYATLARTDNDGITAFNTAFVQDGFFIYVPDGVIVEKPIQLVQILHSKVDFMLNRRLLIILGKHAQLRLLACDHAMDSVNFLSTQVTEIFVGENSTFDFYELEETHTKNIRLSNLFVTQEAGSNVLINGTTLHNGITRNRIHVTLCGERAEINLYGMAIEDKKQHVDTYTFIDHQVPSCSSNEVFKYVLDDAATGAFSGKVLVREGAQKTVSRQTNRNICATKQAHMYTQPQLEIYTDDVQCSHGATVGQLDETALFYMQARGISLKEARMMLMFAFVNEIIDTIRIDVLKDRLHVLTEKRFRGELNKCQGCALCK